MREIKLSWDINTFTRRRGYVYLLPALDWWWEPGLIAFNLNFLLLHIELVFSNA